MIVPVLGNTPSQNVSPSIWMRIRNGRIWSNIAAIPSHLFQAIQRIKNYVMNFFRRRPAVQITFDPPPVIHPTPIVQLNSNIPIQNRYVPPSILPNFSLLHPSLIHSPIQNLPQNNSNNTVQNHNVNQHTNPIVEIKQKIIKMPTDGNSQLHAISEALSRLNPNRNMMTSQQLRQLVSDFMNERLQANDNDGRILLFQIMLDMNEYNLPLENKYKEFEKQLHELQNKIIEIEKLETLNQMPKNTASIRKKALGRKIDALKKSREDAFKEYTQLKIDVNHPEQFIMRFRQDGFTCASSSLHALSIKFQLPIHIYHDFLPATQPECINPTNSAAPPIKLVRSKDNHYDLIVEG